MNATAPVSFPHLAARKLMNLTALLAMIVLGLGATFPGYALDLVAFTGITGPLTSALTQIAALGPGIKALVGFVGFRRRAHLAIGSAQLRPGLVLRRTGHLRRRGPGDRRRDHGRGDLNRWHRHPGDRHASRHLHPAASR
jgi:hypothetical protein